MNKLILITILFLVGCAGAFVPKAFDDKIAFAEQSLAVTTSIATKAILAKKADGSYLVSDDAAKCIRTGLQLAGQGIDQAKVFHGTGNDSAALKSLELAAAGLDALASYLNNGNPVGQCDLAAFRG